MHSLFPAFAGVVDFSALLTAGLGGLLIFLARVCDVSLGTIRTIYMLRGHRLLSAAFALVESAIFITAISAVLAGGVANEPAKVVGYVLGYATGVYVGMSIEQWIASGWTMMRIIDRQMGADLVTRLRDRGYAVTVVPGEGRDGPTLIMFIVIRRKRAPQVLELIRKTAPQAFVTLDSVGQAINGTLPTGHVGEHTRIIASLRSLFRK